MSAERWNAVADALALIVPVLGVIAALIFQW